jgi:hypothetical protein
LKTDNLDIGIGKTKQLSLRVSVGALVKVLFKNPENRKMMLALERIATLRQINGKAEVVIIAKPFGGGVRITDTKVLKQYIGDFNYDSEQSKREEDFRILVRPESWGKIKEICREQLKNSGKKIVDATPDRELAEEFEDSLKIILNPNRYILKLLGMVTEEKPVETDSVRAQGIPTVRIYYLYEAVIISSEIIKMMLSNSKQNSDNDLKKITLEDKRNGGKGRANAILTLEFDELKKMYNSLQHERLNEPVYFNEHQLDSNIPAIIKEINSSKYQYLI